MRMLSPIEHRQEFLALNSILDQFLDSPAASLQPRCDIREDRDHFWLSFDMPGVKKEDIKIEVKDDQLLVSGERRSEIQESEGEGISFHRHERSFGRFERSFNLPNVVNSEKIEANFENGVLNLALPKTPASKGRTIEVQSGSGGLFSKILGNTTAGKKTVNVS